MEIGKRIKMLRNSVEMTQDELGNKLGVKKAAIQKYESGSIVNLKIETIKKLAEIFEVTPAYIMGWDKFDEEINNDQLKRQIRLAELLSDKFNVEIVETIFKTFDLNEEGQNKLFSYMEDITQLDKYMR
ncbi:MAG: helix-turn-helix domain-containing protein [Clostridia bacterium]|nr:helix-turn-helix domain-containing protein [Clostridia bacterium]